MSLASDMRDELTRAVVTTSSEVTAEVSATLHFVKGLHLVGGRTLIEVRLDSPVAARRLRTYLQALYSAKSSIVVVSGPFLRRDKHYVMHVVHKADELVRLTGLVDSLRRPVRGLPLALVVSGTAGAAAIWRGAFLACGLLMEPGRFPSPEVACFDPEVTLAMIGCACKLGASTRSKEVRDAGRVSVHDSDATGTLIFTMGASRIFEAWQERRERREVWDSANRLANFDDTNLRHFTRAAVVMGVRVERAFEILGDNVLAHLFEVGTLHLQCKQASLEELGKHTNPPLTKDAVADRIRHLLAPADKVAHERGIPDTEFALTLDMLEED